MFLKASSDKTLKKSWGAGNCPFFVMYYTYILYSQKINKFYTGQTHDLNRRIQEHNSGKTHFMKSGSPWSLVYSQVHQTRSEAMSLEKRIKKRGVSRFLKDNAINIG